MYGHNCSKNSQWLEHTNDRVGVMFIKGFHVQCMYNIRL